MHSGTNRSRKDTPQFASGITFPNNTASGPDSHIPWPLCTSLNCAVPTLRLPMPLQHISDTARWVAVYRAMETERPDAIFRWAGSGAFSPG